MIIFDYGKYIDEIKENGIGATDQNANLKISLLMQSYINSSYRKSAIIRKVKELTQAYFSGLSEEIINKELSILYDKAKQQNKPIPETKTITLYESEMNKIASLSDEKAMRLAFACLILHKFCGQFAMEGKRECYSCVADCPSDAYRIAGLSTISGKQKDKLWFYLKQAGMVERFRVDNKAFNYNKRNKQICGNYMRVPYLVDLMDDKTDEKPYLQISNYDNLLYTLNYWLGDDTLIPCTDCGIPILKNVKSKCLCADCASRRKKENDKTRYNKTKIA